MSWHDQLNLQNAEALLNLGQNPRLARALAIVREQQDNQGRWLLEYDYAGKTWYEFGAQREPRKWVTLRALRVLKVATQTAAVGQNRHAAVG